MKCRITIAEWWLSAPSFVWMTLFVLVPALIMVVLAF
jgi:hypothetical protein